MDEFFELFNDYAQIVNLSLDKASLNKLFIYYQLVLKWNKLLHLTTLIEPKRFIQRHLLESLYTTQFLFPNLTTVWDLGTGAGIPGLPIALLRPHLSIVLVEANRKKCVFLNEVKAELAIHNLEIQNTRIENLPLLSPHSCITSRAIDRMSRLIPNILEIGYQCSQIIFLVSPDLLKFIQEFQKDWELSSYKIPFSQNNSLLILSRST